MDNVDAADFAVRSKIKKFRGNFEGGWREKKPSSLEPPLVRPSEWLAFLGETIFLYQHNIWPAKSAAADEFSELYDKSFLILRDALVEKTT